MNNRYLSELPAYLIYIALFSVTAGYPFFWDTIQLASKHATFFYSTGFSTIILPNEIDSGHIPSLGIYLASVWKIFGRSLEVSHLAMFPFVIGIVYQVLRLSRRLFERKWYVLAALIVLLDPTLLAQSTLVSPDVLVVFFFLLALNSLLDDDRIFFTLALAGLTLASMRGMMCVAALFITEIILLLLKTKSETGNPIPAKPFKNLKSVIIAYLPAAVTATAFFSWHYYKTGWIGYHENMPWAELFERSDLKGALFNVFVLAWRLADFGRLIVWICGAFCLWHYIRNRPPLPESFRMTMVIFIVLLLIFGATLIMHRNLSGHRYLLPLYLTFSILIISYILNIAGNDLPKKLLFSFTVVFLVSGNFWVYPDRIAKGWDSTLAYLPYFPLRQKMLDYIEKKEIKISETGTGFPNEDKFDFIDLNGNSTSFAIRDLSVNRYILWSNIYNDFSDNEMESLRHWERIKEMRSVQVKMVLFKNPNFK